MKLLTGRYDGLNRAAACYGHEVMKGLLPFMILLASGACPLWAGTAERQSFRSGFLPTTPAFHNFASLRFARCENAGDMDLHGDVDIAEAGRIKLPGVRVGGHAGSKTQGVGAEMPGSLSTVLPFRRSAMTMPIPVITLGTFPSVCQGTTSGSIAFDVSGGTVDLYSIDYSAEANDAGFIDVTDAPVTDNPLAITAPAGAGLGSYAAVITMTNSETQEVSLPAAFEVYIISCNAPYIVLVPLEEGAVNGNATSTTGCDPESGNVMCYGILYTPSVTGTVTSYTNNFFIVCTALGNPVMSNQSCYMTGGASVEEDCEVEMGVVLNASANTGTFGVTAGVPVIIHQVCLSIPLPDTLELLALNNPSVSINLAGGGFADEFPAYSTFSASWAQECLTMPVTWLDFRVARHDGTRAMVAWVTTDEINNSHFEIQRTASLSRPFETIGRVEAALDGGPVHHYSFVDERPHTGISYYRLRQIDLDGRFEYSPIRSLSFGGSLAVTARPNPADVTLYVGITHATGRGVIALYDAAGRRVRQSRFEGSTLTEQIDVSALRPGIYLLSVTDEKSRIVERIMVN